jgi:hypothetical protein
MKIWKFVIMAATAGFIHGVTASEPAFPALHRAAVALTRLPVSSWAGRIGACGQTAFTKYANLVAYYGESRSKTYVASPGDRQSDPTKCEVALEQTGKPTLSNTNFESQRNTPSVPSGAYPESADREGLSPMSFIVGETGEGPNLRPRVTQEQVEGWPLKNIRKNGLRIFTTPFNKYDGYGDGPFVPSEDPRIDGGRSTLQFNGTFLRVNGLDGQTCAECHFIKKNSTIPFTFGIGGTAGPNSNPLFRPSYIDVAEDNPGETNGRFINPPILFGVGGVELVGKEMTTELQQLKRDAIANPGEVIDLVSKGVDFGYIVADSSGNVDTSNVVGVDEDLVVRPFGRKGEFPTVRAFDIGALRFHFGMEPVEDVGLNNDNDADGVVNEITVGELSALDIFVATQETPKNEESKGEVARGFDIFEAIGCTVCHVPTISTNSKLLTFSFPEIETDPTQNIFLEVNLVRVSGFKINRQGGIDVPMFSDLKRHDMGPGLTEDFDLVSDERNAEFITAKLWGVRDSGPYLHDGRALTITEAILALGGEAQAARDSFAALSQSDKDAVIEFLCSLRTPN